MTDKKAEPVKNDIAEKDSHKLKYPDVTPWGTWLMALVCVLFAHNVNFYWVGGVFATGILLSLLVKKRFVVKGLAQFIIVAGILVVFIVLGFAGGLVPKLSMAVGLNQATFYLGIMAMAILLVKCYKVKSRRELYTIYFISLGLFLVGALYSPWKWDPVNAAFFFLFAVASVVYFLELFLINQKTAPGIKPPRLGRMWTLYLVIPLTAFISIAAGINLKRVENNILASLMKRFKPSTFYSYASRADLGRMETLLTSRQVNMKVITSRPISRVRGRVYNGYNRGTWVADGAKARLLPVGKIPGGVIPDRGSKVYPLSPEIPGNGGIKAERFIVDIRRNGLLYRCRGSEAALLPAGDYARDQLGNVHGPFNSLKEYRVVYRPGVAGFPGEAGPDKKDLVIPPKLKEKFSDLAEKITKDRVSNGARVLAVESYLQNNFKYNRGIRLTRRDMDPVEEFLFLRRPAHCEYFASAMVLLLRSRGIPARYVLGFIAHEYSRPGGYYVVRQMDAHAWVIAWIEGRGWVVFDPTPPSGRPDARGNNSTDWLEFIGTRLKQLYELIKKGSPGEFFAVLRDTLKKLTLSLPVIVTLVVVLVLLLIFRFIPALRRRWKRGKKSRGPYPDLDADDPYGRALSELMARFDSYVEKMGIPRPSHIAPKEFAGFLKDAVRRRRKDPEFTGSLPEPDCCRQFLELYSNLRYSCKKIDPASLGELEDIFRQLKQG